MLNLNCVICAELFTPSDEVYVTSCGHMFHHTCLMQWLERSKTCPQCRNKCTTRNILRVYFNVANLDTSRIDVGSLQEQLDNANLAIQLKDREQKKAEQRLRELKDIQKKCLKTISGLEAKVRNNEFTITSYVEQLRMLKNEVLIMDAVRKENNMLKENINLFESVAAMLTATASDTENLLSNESNPRVLASWVSTLKRELRQCESKKVELRNVIKTVQADLRRELDSKRQLEEQVSQLESDLYRTQQKLKINKTKPIELDALNNSLGLNTNLIAIKQEDRRNTISPTTKENIKRIEESTSPYLNIKSSSVGISHLLKPPELSMTKISPIKSGSGISMASHGVIRKTHSDLSEKYSIFKKPRLLMTGTSSSSAAMGSNFAYNGMGGSEKIDPFLQRDEEENEQQNLPTPKPSTINSRLKAGSLRNFKLTK
ncbi:PREDICTED: E3 ubiquitin-protein ligase TRAIP [Drosophila arizonae]|uniref:E3 ubiquitin-protein ligase TRAIP n=1 Tax=Drosophila arizonae TaxID=7263 RepID=A0ABM1PJ32_DROAR|nr:PREDICTED: E3 ubiquitin-protein ligase TRAIP [Drosophila arizonae]